MHALLIFCTLFRLLVALTTQLTITVIISTIANVKTSVVERMTTSRVISVLAVGCGSVCKTELLVLVLVLTIIHFAQGT